MEGALITHDVSIQYVAENNARETPTFFTVISLWAALEGSILLWTLILAGATAYVAWRGTRELPRLATAALAVLLAMVSFFLLLVTTPAADPFVRIDAPANGSGPNPLLRTWNLSLVIATFALTILGTFLTRSGVVNSVHAFTQSAIGPLLLGYFVAIVVLSIGLLLWRMPMLADQSGIGAPLSREAVFLFQNVVFVAAT